MGTNKSKKINHQNLEEWLRSTGFLFPTNELELARFNKLYADYDFQLKGASIDVKTIIEGSTCSNARIIDIGIENNEGISNEIQELKMVARKGQIVPEHIIEKMKQKHRKNDKDEEQ